MRLQVIPVILLCFSTTSLALKPEKEYSLRPENYALIYKDLDVKTEDGFRIKAWFFPAQDSIPDQEWLDFWKNPRRKDYSLKYNQPRPTIIICNGDAGNMSLLIQYAKELVVQGYNAVTFDWRGFGESDSWETNTDQLVYAEYLLDYDAVLNQVLQQPEVDKKRVGVYGFSTGAYLSFATFSQREEISAFAGRALLTTLESAVEQLRKIRPERELIIPENYPMELMPINLAKSIVRPCLLIVGENDEVTPPWMSMEIFNLLRGEKILWVVNDASHGGSNGPDFIDFKRFMHHLQNFFDLNL